MKKFLASLVVAPLLLTNVSAQIANPVYFPCYDAFTSAAGSGGSTYATGALLGGVQATNGQQTNAFGQVWFGIDTGGNVANAITLTGNSLNYLGLPSFTGNQIILTNVAGPGARMFVWPVNIISVGGSGGFFQTGPLSVFYSFVLQVSNVNNLGTGGYICGYGDNGTPLNQSGQPGTVSTRLYFKAAAGGYQLGIAKMATVNYDTVDTFTTNQVLFVVVDYEIQTSDLNSAKTDIVRLWINPATNTFGAATQPAETVNAGQNVDANLTPDTSCFQIYDIANTPNNTLVTSFRMGTNWSWVTGGPNVGIQPPATTNFAPTTTGNLSVLAMNNGSANTYDWQFNGVNLTDGQTIPGSGATVTNSLTSSLTISNIDTNAAGSYTVVVSNTWGAVTSSVCVVTTLGAPTITGESSTNVLLYAGGSNTSSLTVQGLSPFTYYWYSNNTLTVDSTNSFTITNVQSSANLYCIVSNSIGTITSSVISVAAVPLPSQPYPLAVYDDHPIGFWPLNEGPDNTNGDDGAITHDYIEANNGFYSNVVLALPGYGPGLASEFSYALPTDTNTSVEFGPNSADNSYVAQIPNINFASVGAGGPSFSVEAWVNANGNGQLSGATIVDKGFTGSEQFTMDYNNGWRFYVRDAANPSVTAQTTSTADGNWHHLVGVLDTVHSNIIMYVDGIAQATTAYTPSLGILASTYPVTIGSHQATAFGPFVDNFFNGNIEDVAIYNYALTAGQVATHYNAAGIGPSIVAASLPSSTNVDAGTTLVLTPTVNGSPTLSYTWINTSVGSNVPGQTNAELVITNISSNYNNAELQLTVSNQYGTATANPVEVTVYSGPPYSVAVAPSAITVYSDVGTPFQATAIGSTPFYYQWSVNGTNVQGATNAAYTNAAGLTPNTYTIGCTVTNTNGPSSPPVVTASLTVVAAPTDYYALTVISNAPIAFWRLDEPSNSATAYDYVGNHNAAYTSVVNGVPGFSPGFDPTETASAFGTNGETPSEALETNGTANGIPLIDFSAQGANAEFSAELWVQEPAVDSNPVLCKGYPNNTQFSVSTSVADAFQFLVHNGTGTLLTATASTVTDGNWHHVVGVCDEANGEIYVYVDGKRQGSASIPIGSGVWAVANSTYPVTIGAEETSGQGFGNITNANLAQVALYNYAMTSNQVAADYAAATQLPPLSPFSITSVSNVIGTSVTLNWLSVSNYTYQVQAASVLAHGTNAWTNLGSPIVATGTNTSYTDSSTNATGVAGYYRVIGY